MYIWLQTVWAKTLYDLKIITKVNHRIQYMSFQKTYGNKSLRFFWACWIYLANVITFAVHFSSSVTHEQMLFERVLYSWLIVMWFFTPSLLTSSVSVSLTHQSHSRWTSPHAGIIHLQLIMLQSVKVVRIKDRLTRRPFKNSTFLIWQALIWLAGFTAWVFKVFNQISRKNFTPCPNQTPDSSDQQFRCVRNRIIL